jgi:hypothetical protein
MSYWVQTLLPFAIKLAVTHLIIILTQYQMGELKPDGPESYLQAIAPQDKEKS